MGFGLDSIVTVDTDSQGRMIPSALEKAIKNSVANVSKPLTYRCLMQTLEQIIMREVYFSWRKQDHAEKCVKSHCYWKFT